MASFSFNKTLSETSLWYNILEIYIHDYLQCSSFILSWSNYFKICKCPGQHDLHMNIKYFYTFNILEQRLMKQ